MDTVLNQFPPPPYNENSENESQLEKKYKADRYKIIGLLTHALVYLIMIIVLLFFTVAALLLNPKCQTQWTS